MTDELFLGKGNEKKTFFFFFPLRGNTIFWYEWINDQRPCPRKKNTVTLKPFFFVFFSEILCVKIKSLAWKKSFLCAWKFTTNAWKKSFLCAWKFTPNTWKVMKKSTWKTLPVRENFEKSVRETQLPYVKKVKKSPKNRFTHTFYFHVVKKKHWGGGEGIFFSNRK